MNTALAPIVMLVYRRPEHTARTLASLCANSLARHSELYIFADGAKGSQDQAGVAAVRALVREQIEAGQQADDGFRRIHLLERSRNFGLAANVIAAVDQVIQQHGRVIVVEDDLLFSRHFLAFMNRALDTYQQHPKLFSITGYGYPAALLSIPDDYPHDVYLSHRGGSLGWATWLDRWQCVDWQVSDHHQFERDRAAQRAFNQGGADLTPMLRSQLRGEIDSWAVRWAYARFRQGGYALVPVRAYVDTTGHDNSGTHGESGYTRLRNDLGAALPYPDLPLDLELDERILAGIRRIFAPSLPGRAKMLVQGLLRRLTGNNALGRGKPEQAAKHGSPGKKKAG